MDVVLRLICEFPYFGSFREYTLSVAVGWKLFASTDHEMPYVGSPFEYKLEVAVSWRLSVHTGTSVILKLKTMEQSKKNRTA